MQTRKRKDVLLAMTPVVPWRGDGVRRFAREAGWKLIDASRLVGGIGGLAGWRGDGAIVTLRDEPETLAFVRRLRRAGIPVVDLSNQRPDIKVPRVCLDNIAIGRLAAAHFAAFNHRHAAWFSTHWMNVHAQRFEGFCEGWADAARTECSPHHAALGTARREAAPPERWVLRDGIPPGRWNDARAVARWFAARLRAAPKPLAIFCHCVEDAARILAECETCGIRVPEEMAILATGDDQTVCETQSVPLSCIPHQGERHGYEAAALLQRLMDGKPPPRGPILIPPGEIVIRASTDWTAAADPLVARALALVSENLSRPWGVAQLAMELGVTPLKLGRHFTAELGHPPGEEILRQRLAKARTLMRETAFTLDAIAARCGFCHASYLSNVFRRAMGLSPREWRNAPNRGESSPAFSEPSSLSSLVVGGIDSARTEWYHCVQSPRRKYSSRKRCLSSPG